MSPAKSKTATRKPVKRRKPNPNPTGRPSKILDTEKVEKILELLRAGVPQEAAVRSERLAVSTYFLWKKRGAAALEATGLDNPTPADVPVKERPFAEFSEAVDTARAEAEVAYALIVRRGAGQGDVKAAQWWLDRAHPERWARKETHEFAGAAGTDVAIRLRFPGDPIEDEREERK